MKERPALFNGDMVRAILEGRKTQTRRVVKPQPRILAGDLLCWKDNATTRDELIERCPFGKPGDRLWVRETWGVVSHAFDDDGCHAKWNPDRPTTAIHEMPFGNGYYSGHVIYRADGEFSWSADDSAFDEKSCWKPSIHMRREASRITLEIVSVRVERLNEISEQDAVAEGIEPIIDNSPFCGVRGWKDYMKPQSLPFDSDKPAASFVSLWESINGAGSWQQNPWVWALMFKQVQP